MSIASIAQMLEPLVSARLRVAAVADGNDMPDPPPVVKLSDVQARLASAVEVRVNGKRRIFSLARDGAWPGAYITVIAEQAGDDGDERELLDEFGRLLEAAKRRLPTPRPYVLLEATGAPPPAKKRGATRAGALRQGATKARPASRTWFLVTEGFHGAELFGAYLREHAGSLQNSALMRDRIARDLGAFTARLHDAGLFWDALELDDLALPARSGTERQNPLRLLTLRQASFHDASDDARAVTALARLSLAVRPLTERPDRMRFLLAYLERRGRDEDALPDLVARIMEETRKLGVGSTPAGHTGMSRESAAGAANQSNAAAADDDGRTTTSALRKDTFVVPLDAILSSRQINPHTRVTVLNRVGRMLCDAIASGAVGGTRPSLDLLTRIGVEMTYLEPDPRPMLMDTLTNAPGGAPAPDAASTDRLLLPWLTVFAARYSLTAAGHVARGYLRHAAFGKPREVWKQRLRGVIGGR